jgi:molecular chaperone GrpE
VFDPKLHEALSMVVNETVEPNTILVVAQKGFLLQERLLRPARVVVSKRGDAT